MSVMWCAGQVRPITEIKRALINFLPMVWKSFKC